MSLIRDFISRIRRKRTTPIINTPHGPVTESARAQAALNIKADPALRERVFAVIVKEYGGDVARANAEMKRRYPEVFK